MRIAFQHNREKELLGVIRSLPPEKKEIYRKLWIELKKERVNKKNGVEPLSPQIPPEIPE